LATPGRQAHLAQREQPAQPAQPVRPAQPDLKAPLGRKAPKAIQVLLDLPAVPVQRGRLVRRGRKGLPVLHQQ